MISAPPFPRSVRRRRFGTSPGEFKQHSVPPLEVINLEQESEDKAPLEEERSTSSKEIQYLEVIIIEDEEEALISREDEQTEEEVMILEPNLPESRVSEPSATKDTTSLKPQPTMKYREDISKRLLKREVIPREPNHSESRMDEPEKESPAIPASENCGESASQEHSNTEASRSIEQHKLSPGPWISAQTEDEKLE